MRLLRVLTCLALCGSTYAQSAEPPAFKPLRYDENYSYLRDPAKHSDYLDRIKFIRLNADGSRYLTLGGEIRERYERYHNTTWGRGPQDNNGYLLERYMVHVDAHLGDAFRTFVQFKSGLERDRNGGPRPTDEDKLDVHQAFADLRLTGESPVLVRIGRQELAYGSSRLVSVREGPNVRASFDGAKLIVKKSGWQVDAFATRPVRTRARLFDDSTDTSQAFWGLYAVKAVAWLPHGNVDLYYLGLENDTARFDQGAAREVRHTIGSRIWGNKSGVDYNFELVYQLGTFGRGNIRAWTAASDTGFTFETIPLHPRIGGKVDITSGDNDPTNANLQTFKPLFPRGAYFGEPALIGPSNHIDAHPQVDLEIQRKLAMTLDWDWFWRESTRDGIYGPSVNLIQSGQTSTARFVGQQAEVMMQWSVDRHTTLSADYAHFFAGNFLRQTTPGKRLDYVSTWVTYKF